MKSINFLLKLYYLINGSNIKKKLNACFLFAISLDVIT